MQVIENKDTIKITCPSCKSLLAISVEDIVDNELTGYSVKCGVISCGTHIQVNGSLLPATWKAIIHADDIL